MATKWTVHVETSSLMIELRVIHRIPQGTLYLDSFCSWVTISCGLGALKSNSFRCRRVATKLAKNQGFWAFCARGFGNEIATTSRCELFVVESSRDGFTMSRQTLGI